MTPLERAAREVSADLARVAANLVSDPTGGMGVWSSAVAADYLSRTKAKIDAALAEGE